MRMSSPGPSACQVEGHVTSTTSCDIGISPPFFRIPWLASTPRELTGMLLITIDLD
jgi:hypothetical protein